LLERLEEEQRQRTGTDRELAGVLAKLQASLDDEVARSANALARLQRDAMQAVRDLGKQNAAAIQHVHVELAARLDDERSSLQGGKVDRSQLASMLSELIVRLNGASEAPAARH
jgi:hypothetical protein